MTDPQRIQLDLKNLPEGAVPALVQKALEAGYPRLSAYCRDILLREAGYARGR